MKGVSHTDPVGTEFAMRVMKRLRKACDDWKAETNIGFALYGTPAESLCYRFARIDRERFGDIPDAVSYTHLDVYKRQDKVEALSINFKFTASFVHLCIPGFQIDAESVLWGPGRRGSP